MYVLRNKITRRACRSQIFPTGLLLSNKPPRHCELVFRWLFELGAIHVPIFTIYSFIHSITLEFIGDICMHHMMSVGGRTICKAFVSYACTIRIKRNSDVLFFSILAWRNHAQFNTDLPIRLVGTAIPHYNGYCAPLLYENYRKKFTMICQRKFLYYATDIEGGRERITQK